MDERTNEWMDGWMKPEIIHFSDNMPHSQGFRAQSLCTSSALGYEGDG